MKSNLNMRRLRQLKLEAEQLTNWIKRGEFNLLKRHDKKYVLEFAKKHGVNAGRLENMIKVFDENFRVKVRDKK